jgi:hypothetical protein
MRKLSLLLVLLLLSVLLAAVSVHASFAPGLNQATQFVAPEAEEDDGEDDEGEEAGEEESDDCVVEDEEDAQLCAEIAEEEREEAKAEPCVLEDARAVVVAHPGKRRLRLTVHYRTSKPALVSVAAILQGPKGTVHLGTDHARFHRSGVYRDTYELAEKQMKKALAASGFAVELNVINAPASCAVELTGASPRARR